MPLFFFCLLLEASRAIQYLSRDCGGAGRLASPFVYFPRPALGLLPPAPPPPPPIPPPSPPPLFAPLNTRLPSYVPPLPSPTTIVRPPTYSFIIQPSYVPPHPPRPRSIPPPPSHDRILWFRRLTLRARHLRGLVVSSSSSATAGLRKTDGNTNTERSSAESTAERGGAEGVSAGGGGSAAANKGTGECVRRM